MRCAGIGTRVAPGMSHPAVLPAHAACDVAAPSMDVSIKKAPILIAAVLLPSYALARAPVPSGRAVRTSPTRARITWQLRCSPWETTSSIAIVATGILRFLVIVFTLRCGNSFWSNSW
jgi:hypothetical protein